MDEKARKLKPHPGEDDVDPGQKLPPSTSKPSPRPPGMASDDEIFSMTRTAKDGEVLQIPEEDEFDEDGRPVSDQTQAALGTEVPVAASPNVPREPADLHDDVWGKKASVPQPEDTGDEKIKDIWGDARSEDLIKVRSPEVIAKERELLQKNLSDFKKEFLEEEETGDAGAAKAEGTAVGEGERLQRPKDVERTPEPKRAVRETEADKDGDGDEGDDDVDDAEDEDVTVPLKGESGYARPGSEDDGGKTTKKNRRKGDKAARTGPVTGPRVPIEEQAERLLRRQWLRKGEDVDVDEVFATVGMDEKEREEYLQQKKLDREEAEEDDGKEDVAPVPKRGHAWTAIETKDRSKDDRGGDLGIDVSDIDDRTRRELEMPPLPMEFKYPIKHFRNEFRMHVLLYFIPFMFIIFMLYLKMMALLPVLIAVALFIVITYSMISEALTPMVGTHLVTRKGLLINQGWKFSMRIPFQDISSVQYFDEAPPKMGVHHMKGSGRLFVVSAPEDMVSIRLRRDMHYGKKGYIEEIIMNVEEPDVFIRNMSALLDAKDILDTDEGGPSKTSSHEKARGDEIATRSKKAAKATGRTKGKR